MGKRNVSVIKDAEGHNIVMINDICFKGKNIDWNEVECYLKRYVGEFYRIAEENEIIFIGTKLPGEYKGSVYTKSLRGGNEKAKANAVQALPEMIEIATNGVFEKNRKKKHERDEKYGWYRYETRFAIPIYDNNDEIDRYNVFQARLLIKHSANGKKYLHDIMEIKKETSKSCQA